MQTSKSYVPSHRRPQLALTVGDPAGIGPDVAAAALAHGLDADVIVIGDHEVLHERAAKLQLKLDLPDYEQSAQQPASLIQIDTHASVVCGKPDDANALHVLAQLNCAHELASSGKADGIVTGPISKANINAVHAGFTGHTGYFAQLCNVPRAVMAFVGPRIKAALVTEHLPLAEVAQAISSDAIVDTLCIADQGMRMLLGKDVSWRVCGLNPHAGECGLLGTEEADAIVPAIRQARTRGINASGPVAADTAFLDDECCVLAMYHDQLLPVVKRDAFAETVNVTFGLNYVRTSVDHGTAYDLAGRGIADHKPLRSAVALAANLAA